MEEDDDKRESLVFLCMEAFTHAVEAGPHQGSLWTQLGLLGLGEGDYKKAESCFRTSLQRDASLVAAWCDLGIALQVRGSRFQSLYGAGH